MGLRGVGAGDLKLPAPSVIPVAYFLYSNKAEFDTVWVFWVKGHWGPSGHAWGRKGVLETWVDKRWGREKRVVLQRPDMWWRQERCEGDLSGHGHVGLWLNQNPKANEKSPQHSPGHPKHTSLLRLCQLLRLSCTPPEAAA